MVLSLHTMGIVHITGNWTSSFCHMIVMLCAFCVHVTPDHSIDAFCESLIAIHKICTSCLAAHTFKYG